MTGTGVAARGTAVDFVAGAIGIGGSDGIGSCGAGGATVLVGGRCGCAVADCNGRPLTWSCTGGVADDRLVLFMRSFDAAATPVGGNAGVIGLDGMGPERMDDSFRDIPGTVAGVAVRGGGAGPGVPARWGGAGVTAGDTRAGVLVRAERTGVAAEAEATGVADRVTGTGVAGRSTFGCAGDMVLLDTAAGATGTGFGGGATGIIFAIGGPGGSPAAHELEDIAGCPGAGSGGAFGA
jgi:hypothetical protein